MTDTHIHIGQFKEVYYSSEEVFNTVFSSGIINHLVFSSTTSCIDDIKYETVGSEIENALKIYNLDKITPLLWYIPEYISQGIKIKNAMEDLPYKGFKLHPLINNWDFSNPNHIKILHDMFEYASQNKMFILIHTGEGEIHSPSRFQYFFNLYPTVKFILAHSRPPEITISMLQKYNNVYCDTSFAPKEDINKIISAGFSSRILFGSDFPITHYYKTKYSSQNNSLSTLNDQYYEDIEQLRSD